MTSRHAETDPQAIAAVIIDLDETTGEYIVTEPILACDGETWLTDRRESWRCRTYLRAVYRQGELMELSRLPGQTTHRACVAAGV